jgi:putative restriction endonuclease
MDEVNFWRPLAQSPFKALSPGEPFFFRLKHPHNCIAGYGFFAHATRLPLRLAWDAFGLRNGDPSFERFVNRIAEYRKESPLEAVLSSKELTCLVLRSAYFFPPERWIEWGIDRGWERNIVSFKTYDMASGDGQMLRAILQNGQPPEFGEAFELVDLDRRRLVEALSVVREGQGAFRVRVLDAYGRRCAITGERALPTLDAAHIQPYRGPASNHIQNGLALRADIHRLYDSGYVTVTGDYKFQASRSLKDDFDNGALYYGLHGQRLVNVPTTPALRPSRDALDWHAKTIFRQ